jgi:hypothetical protein
MTEQAESHGLHGKVQKEKPSKTGSRACPSAADNFSFLVYLMSGQRSAVCQPLPPLPGIQTLSRLLHLA